MTTINYAAALPVLRRGRERIAKGWTQQAFARCGDGGGCNPNEPLAVCWCADGALCYDGFHTPGSVDAKNLLDSLCDNNDIHNWNDAPGRTQAEVLALFDRAIAECESQVSMTAREGE